AWCQSCDPFKTTQGWTSGNNDIDDCIREFQLKSTTYEDVIEWIPFNRLSNLHKIGSSFQALWLDGIRKVVNHTQSRTSPYSVEIEKFNYSQIETLEFIKEFKNYMQLRDKRKIYGITQSTTTKKFMIVLDNFYYKRDIKYGKCTQCERHNTSEAWCQSCDPFKATQGWTTLWLDGIRKVENNTQSRTLSYPVEIKKFNNSQIDILKFIKELKDNKRKLYGVTQDTTNQYMLVFNDFYYKRDVKYGKCTQCERHNTSEAWCQSCDPFKATQGWTSGNIDVDNCIKESQLKNTKYETVIEWIPFNRLSNLRNPLSRWTNNVEPEVEALWLDGIRMVKNNIKSRSVLYAVYLKEFNSKMDVLEFMKYYMRSEFNERKLCGITQDTTTNQYMVVFDDFYYKRDIKYGECTQCKRYNTSEAWCQSCDPYKATQGWTSGNKDIDNCIREFQLKSTTYEDVIEWIPFNRLSNLHKIGSSFQALWLDGIRKVGDNTQSRTLSYSVEIKKFNYSQIDTLEFIKELKNYAQLRDIERKIFGITQDTTTDQYIIVFDDFYHRRNFVYGKCAQCKRYNTTKAWCQSCDPFKTTQGWTSGNNDIDELIKEAQLKSTEYENVIEWIPFNRLTNLKKIGLNFQAVWLDGIRNVRNNTQSRLLSHTVELKKFNDSQINTLEFIKNYKNYVQFKNNECKLYGITQDAATNHYMIVFDDFYHRRGISDGECPNCERSNTSKAWCQSCDPFKTTQGWTSGNRDIDKCIKEFQLKSTRYENVIEWIPANMLLNLQKIGESKFIALFIDGIRKVKNNSQSRTLSCAIKLEKFDDSHIDTSNFIKKFKKYMQLINNESKLYGIMQDTTTGQYMIAFDDFYYKRDIIYGKCIHCERYNTSEAWCQSCDLFETIQGWTSGNNDIDECIKEFQLKTTKYEDVIEWIPFYKLSNLQNIREFEFRAQWLDGIRKVESRKLSRSQVNTLEFVQSRTLSHEVELKKLNNSQIDALEFIKKFKNFMQSKDSKLRLYGITKDTTTNQYMIVFDGFHHGRDIIYGICAHCNRYNTSEAWCQSCDPFKVTQ
ncbi:4266_t:CDS:2, partial [Acaulospora morrowiae]